MKQLALEGVWRLRAEFLDVGIERFHEVLEREPGRFDVRFDVPPNAFPVRHGFMKATVPCDVMQPLIENGIVQEPFFQTHTRDCLWIRDLSWWFIREFTVEDDLLSCDEVRLYIEMLDYKADILVNGRPVGQHKNAFRPFHQEVKRFLKPGENQIIIRLTSGTEDFYPHDAISFYCGSVNAICDQRIYLRKPQFTYGWDWCQPVPTCGIGRAIRLEGVSGARVCAVRCDTVSLHENTADMELSLELEKTVMHASAEATIHFALSFAEETVASGSLDTLLVGGRNFLTHSFTLQNPKLWWPNGYGPQSLYTLRVWCECADAVNEMQPVKIGVRTLTLDQSKLPDGTRNFRFVVNGVGVFCKGGNWVPTDSLYLRTPDATYRTLVEEASRLHFTMLRMWGGGTYEPDCFYEYCSEHGILLMHDFMYSCAFYPDHLDWFFHEATLEADFQTKRLAHYPCMAIWTGNNEIHESITDWFKDDLALETFWGARIFNEMQPDMVHKNSPRIPYMPSTPYFGSIANQTDMGDVHAWTYFGRNPNTKFKFEYELEAFDRIPARFSSEYGFFGAPMESTVRKYVGDAAMRFDAPAWIHHGEFARKRKAIDGAIDRHLIDFSTLDERAYLLYGGVMQGLLYAELAEAMRAKPFGAGDLIWMYNDCWPETGWTVIDYDLTRKISFYFLQRAFAPRKLILRATDHGARLTLINESPTSVDLALECGYMRFTGEKQGVQRINITLEPHAWRQTDVALAGDLSCGMFYAVPIDANTDFAPAVSLRAYYRDVLFPETNLHIASLHAEGDDLLVTLRTNVFTPVVRLATSDDRIRYSDNYFSLLPGDNKVVRLLRCQETPTVSAVRFTPNAATQYTSNARRNNP